MTASVESLRILHVDDEQGFRDLASTALERVDNRIAVELTGGPLEGADGELRGITGIGRDITERKTHERRLEALNRATRRLLTAEDPDELASLGVELGQEVLGLDANSIHLYDEATDRLEPAAATDALTDLVGTLPSFERDQSIAWRAFETGEPMIVDPVTEEPDVYNPETSIESELYLPLGSFGLLIAASRNTGSFDQQDALVGEILAANMVTALEQIERRAELRTREIELAQQNERLERFASIASHDLRNPLSVATGRLELAQSECDSDHLVEVEQAHERMEELIDDLLSLARRGESATETQPIELPELLNSCWATVETNGGSLETTLEERIVADESRLRQLFENLFRNAIEHGGQTVTVRVGSLEDGFYIEDDGPGIPKVDRESVFEAGYTTTPDGTGFGLSIVKDIVEEHGWNISLTEGIDGGTRFEITGVDRLDQRSRTDRDWADNIDE